MNIQKNLFTLLLLLMSVTMLGCSGCGRNHDEKEANDEIAGEEITFPEYKVSLAFPAEAIDSGYYNISIKIGDKGPFTREVHSLKDATGPHVLKDIKTKNLATIDVKVFDEKVIKIFEGTGVVTKDIPEVTISLTAVSAEDQDEQAAACKEFTANISSLTIVKLDPEPGEVIDVSAVIDNPNKSEIHVEWSSSAENGSFGDVSKLNTTFTTPSSVATNPYAIKLKLKIGPIDSDGFCKEKPQNINVIQNDDNTPSDEIKLIITTPDGTYSNHPAVELNESTPEKIIKLEAVAKNGVTYNWEEDGILIGSDYNKKEWTKNISWDPNKSEFDGCYIIKYKVTILDKDNKEIGAPTEDLYVCPFLPDPASHCNAVTLHPPVYTPVKGEESHLKYLVYLSVEKNGDENDATEFLKNSREPLVDIPEETIDGQYKLKIDSFEISCPLGDESQTKCGNYSYNDFINNQFNFVWETETPAEYRDTEGDFLIYNRSRQITTYYKYNVDGDLCPPVAFKEYALNIAPPVGRLKFIANIMKSGEWIPYPEHLQNISGKNDQFDCRTKVENNGPWKDENEKEWCTAILEGMEESTKEQCFGIVSPGEFRSPRYKVKSDTLETFAYGFKLEGYGMRQNIRQSFYLTTPINYGDNGYWWYAGDPFTKDISSIPGDYSIYYLGACYDFDDKASDYVAVQKSEPSTIVDKNTPEESLLLYKPGEFFLMEDNHLEIFDTLITDNNNTSEYDTNDMQLAYYYTPVYMKTYPLIGFDSGYAGNDDYGYLNNYIECTEAELPEFYAYYANEENQGIYECDLSNPDSPIVRIYSPEIQRDGTDEDVGKRRSSIDFRAIQAGFGFANKYNNHVITVELDESNLKNSQILTFPKTLTDKGFTKDECFILPQLLNVITEPAYNYVPDKNAYSWNYKLEMATNNDDPFAKESAITLEDNEIAMRTCIQKCGISSNNTGGNVDHTKDSCDWVKDCIAPGSYDDITPEPDYYKENTASAIVVCSKFYDPKTVSP